MADPTENPAYQEGWNNAAATALNIIDKYVDSREAPQQLYYDIEDLINE